MKKWDFIWFKEGVEVLVKKKLYSARGVVVLRLV